jgi:hypothetical protein
VCMLCLSLQPDKASVDSGEVLREKAGRAGEGQQGARRARMTV